MGRTAKTQRLTALALKKYANDAAVTAPFHDGGGLYLRKRGSALHWVLRLTDPASGAQQWHRLFPDDPLGVYPHKSLADARAEARRLWSTRSGGIDPRVERRRRIEAEREAEHEARLAAERRITMHQLFERWVSIELTPRIAADGRRLGRKDGGAFTRAQFERRVFARLGDVPAEDVRRGDLLALLDAVKAEGKLRTANVLLTDLKRCFGSHSRATSFSETHSTRSPSAKSEGLQWIGSERSRRTKSGCWPRPCPTPDCKSVSCAVSG